MKTALVTSAAIMGLACTASAQDLLYDRSDMVTHPGDGAGGADVSMASVEVNTAGSNINTFNDHFRIADVFWVDGDWEVDRIRVYVYATGGDANNPQFDGFDLNIWDGIPADENSNVVATSDDFSNMEWTGIYRVFNGSGNLGNTDRPIIQVDIEFDGVDLEPGYHWFDWQADSPTSAWAPYVMEPNPDDPHDPITVEGTGWQFVDTGEWNPMDVGDAELQPSMPVQVWGTSDVACPEDLTGDGHVGGADLGTLLAAWGECPDPDNCPEDLTGDGNVGGADLGTLLAAWGECPDTGIPAADPLGACCLMDGSCEMLTEAECAAQDGDYSNDFTPCEFVECFAFGCGHPDLGDCCEANDTPYCDNEECCEQICADDPFCCDNVWDADCAAAAQDECAVCDEIACGHPEAGDCCEGQTGSPFCDDAECCECICDCDPFCCDTNWDSLCAGDGFVGDCGASNPNSPCTEECSQCL